MKQITFTLLLAFLFVNSTKAQELRLYGSVQIFGGISEAFVGPGIGFENDISRHFTLNADVNAGFNSKSTAIEFKPAVQYYFNSAKRGFYIGPSLKYVSFKGKKGHDELDGNIYSAGLNLGIKTEFKNKFTFLLNTSPHFPIEDKYTNSGNISVQLGLGIKL